jgi:hypothetical protein
MNELSMVRGLLVCGGASVILFLTDEVFFIFLTAGQVIQNPLMT